MGGSGTLEEEPASCFMCWQMQGQRAQLVDLLPGSVELAALLLSVLVLPVPDRSTCGRLSGCPCPLLTWMRLSPRLASAVSDAR